MNPTPSKFSITVFGIPIGVPVIAAALGVLSPTIIWYMNVNTSMAQTIVNTENIGKNSDKIENMGRDLAEIKGNVRAIAGFLGVLPKGKRND